jgi:phosphoglycolate phosphatase
MANILFDLDGTLTDPGPGIIGSIVHALERMGATVPDDAGLRACIGPPLRSTFARLLGSDDPVAIERAVALYRERFAPIGIFENRVYDGVPAMLAALLDRGDRLFIATSKPQPFAEQVIAHFALEGFERIYGSALDGSLDDKALIVRMILEREGLDADSTFMVGDRSHDIVAARANGVAGVGVLYGYGTREELAGAGAAHIVATPREIPDVLTS